MKMYLPFLSGDSGRSISPLTRRPLAGGADGALNFVVSKAAKIPFRSSGRTASRRLRAAAFLLASPMQKSWATVFASAAESLAASWPMAAAPKKTSQINIRGVRMWITSTSSRREPTTSRITPPTRARRTRVRRSRHAKSPRGRRRRRRRAEIECPRSSTTSASRRTSRDAGS